MINSKNGRVTGMIKPKVLLFSQRLEIAERFNAWAEANKVSKEPESFLAFLQGNHLINEEAAMLFIEAELENTNTEPKTVIVDDIPKDETWFGVWFGRCPNCKQMLKKKEHEHFCGYCGQAVKWHA